MAAAAVSDDGQDLNVQNSRSRALTRKSCSSIRNGNHRASRPTDLVYALPETLPPRTARLEEHGVIGDGVDRRVQAQEGVGNRATVRRVQRPEDLWGKESADGHQLRSRRPAEGGWLRTAMMSASRTTTSDSSSAMMIFTFRGVM